MKVSASILLLLMCGQMLAQSQTLADAAREAREKKFPDKKITSRKKIYTNETLVLSSESDAPSTPSPKEQEYSATKKTTALQWKADIARQKNVVTALQSKIEQVEKSIQFVNVSDYYNEQQATQYNAVQKRKQGQVEIAKGRLEQEKQKLEALKEAARKAGFGSSVYDQ